MMNFFGQQGFGHSMGGGPQAFGGRNGMPDFFNDPTFWQGIFANYMPQAAQPTASPTGQKQPKQPYQLFGGQRVQPAPAPTPQQTEMDRWNAAGGYNADVYAAYKQADPNFVIPGSTPAPAPVSTNVHDSPYTVTDVNDPWFYNTNNTAYTSKIANGPGATTRGNVTTSAGVNYKGPQSYTSGQVDKMVNPNSIVKTNTGAGVRSRGDVPSVLNSNVPQFGQDPRGIAQAWNNRQNPQAGGMRR